MVMSSRFGRNKKESCADGLDRETPFRDAYVDEAQAIRYRDKFAASRFRRFADRRERRQVRRLLDRAAVGGGLVLDVPSGAGRFLGEATGRGRRVVAGDSSATMLRLGCVAGARLAGWVGAVALSAMRLPFRDGAFDGVVCIRFLHHFETPEERAEVLASLRRVSRDWVVVSFFASGSIQAFRRDIRRRWFGRPSRRYAIPRRVFVREAERAGLRVESLRSSFRGCSEWSVALLRRVGGATEGDRGRPPGQ